MFVYVEISPVLFPKTIDLSKEYLSKVTHIIYNLYHFRFKRICVFTFIPDCTISDIVKVRSVILQAKILNWFWTMYTNQVM